MKENHHPERYVIALLQIRKQALRVATSVIQGQKRGKIWLQVCLMPNKIIT